MQFISDSCHPANQLKWLPLAIDSQQFLYYHIHKLNGFFILVSIIILAWWFLTHTHKENSIHCLLIRYFVLFKSLFSVFYFLHIRWRCFYSIYFNWWLDQLKYIYLIEIICLPTQSLFQVNLNCFSRFFVSLSNEIIGRE